MKKEKIVQTAFPILISILLFSLLLGFLYRYDNKYTYDCLQPVSGTLVLNEEDLAENGVYYLTKGWQLYPDILLSPDDFAGEHLPSTYMQTVTIGRHSTFAFDAPSRSTSGCATYHLTLILPEEAASYTLILPEIYSCYRLYVNGKEIASEGSPKPENFVEKISQTDVVFTAGGRTELLIAVSIVFDRLFPGWAPIVGGWPSEYGFAAMILGISLILWKTLSEGYRFKLTFEDEKRQLTRQIAIQKAHYQELNEKIEEAVRLRHDERHHLQTLYNIYETKDYSQLHCGRTRRPVCIRT